MGSNTRQHGGELGGFSSAGPLPSAPGCSWPLPNRFHANPLELTRGVSSAAPLCHSPGGEADANQDLDDRKAGPDTTELGDRL